MARSVFPEIRDTLKAAGFSEFEDYCDIENPLPRDEWRSIVPEALPSYPICGGMEYDLFNTQRPRSCVGCGSLERTRTMVKLFTEHLGMERLRGDVLHISPGKAERMFLRQAGADRPMGFPYAASVFLTSDVLTEDFPSRPREEAPAVTG